ncbi:MAG: carboxymuconolactone decarboxylase family protein [Saprospiraceae bacterium]|nr:carboxymuconolactone decarboxylase family protein [Saprospiraceae bacterium]
MVEEFRKKRKRLSELMRENSGLTTQRFLSLDGQAYREGELDEKTKEMLGLVASLVLRCDDCICYHLDQSYNKGVTDKELDEIFAIGLVVGGSITIPHIRRGWEFWKAISSET